MAVRRISLVEGKKAYFASDFHIRDAQYDQSRHQYITQWLEMVRDDGQLLILLGDIFDYWFEYSRVVPRGFFEIMHQLRLVRDAGVEIILFRGNHDIWAGRFFVEELGIKVVTHALDLQINDKRFYMEHGHDLSTIPQQNKWLISLFKNKSCQKLFALLHPSLGLRLMMYFSRKSREQENVYAMNHPVKKWSSFLHTAKIGLTKRADYYIYGHMHAPAFTDMPVINATYVNLGEWITQRSYAVFEGDALSLLFFKNDQGHLFD